MLTTLIFLAVLAFVLNVLSNLTRTTEKGRVTGPGLVLLGVAFLQLAAVTLVLFQVDRNQKHKDRRNAQLIAEARAKFAESQLQERERFEQTRERLEVQVAYQVEALRRATLNFEEVQRAAIAIRESERTLAKQVQINRTILELQSEIAGLRSTRAEWTRAWDWYVDYRTNLLEDIGSGRVAIDRQRGRALELAFAALEETFRQGFDTLDQTIAVRNEEIRWLANQPDHLSQPHVYQVAGYEGP